jgi:hypothetical protein
MLLCHPQGIFFITTRNICILVSRKGETGEKRYSEDAYINSAHILLLQGYLGNEVIPTYPQVAKLPNYLHRKSDC